MIEHALQEWFRAILVTAGGLLEGPCLKTAPWKRQKAKTKSALARVEVPAT